VNVRSLFRQDKEKVKEKDKYKVIGQEKE